MKKRKYYCLWRQIAKAKFAGQRSVLYTATPEINAGISGSGKVIRHKRRGLNRRVPNIIFITRYIIKLADGITIGFIPYPWYRRGFAADKQLPVFFIYL